MVNFVSISTFFLNGVLTRALWGSSRSYEKATWCDKLGLDHTRGKTNFVATLLPSKFSQVIIILLFPYTLLPLLLSFFVRWRPASVSAARWCQVEPNWLLLSLLIKKKWHKPVIQHLFLDEISNFFQRALVPSYSSKIWQLWASLAVMALWEMTRGDDGWRKEKEEEGSELRNRTSRKEAFFLPFLLRCSRVFFKVAISRNL